MANVIGLNEEKVNNIMERFNADSAEVLEELTKEFNNVLKKISENWGTNDGVKHVTDNVIPAFQKTGQNIASMIKEIGSTVKYTAERQAADTNNTMSIVSPVTAQLGAIANPMKEKLSNGYVGVYDSLASEVAEVQERLENDVIAKLERLKGRLVEECKYAFKDETNSVSNAADNYIAQIKNALHQGFTSIKGDIDKLTADATRYAKDIQAAGLRGASSN